MPNTFSRKAAREQNEADSTTRGRRRGGRRESYRSSDGSMVPNARSLGEVNIVLRTKQGVQYYPGERIVLDDGTPATTMPMECFLGEDLPNFRPSPHLPNVEYQAVESGD